MLDRHDLYIGGNWQSSTSDAALRVVNPATAEQIGSAPIATPQDVDRAVTAARTAFVSGWASAAPAERADAMRRLGRCLSDRGAEIARQVSTEMGMPIGLSQSSNADFPVAILQYFEGIARGLVGEVTKPAVGYPGLTTVRYQPRGVVAMIVPWNYPIVLLMSKLAPALAAGCTAVFKPSPETSLSAYLIAEAVSAAQLPAGVFNLVTGDGATGEALVRHPDVAEVSFTGSTPVGRRIGAIAGERLVPVNLELGGKSAAIILEDADLGKAMPELDRISFLNSGQTCFSMSRILAPASRYNEVVDRLVAVAEAHVLGDPLDPLTTMGPLASSGQRDRVESYLVSGREQGARVACGGARPAVGSDGFFIQPTVFSDATNSMRIAREEIFGPVLTVIGYRDEAEAIAIANDSEFGLAGSVWTADTARGHAVAARIEAGTVGVNTYVPDLGAPWGGIKASGSGRENGAEAVEHYRAVKAFYQPASA